MVTTKQIPIVDKQKIMRKKSKHITKESHHTTKRAREEETELQNKIKKTKTINKMSVST